MQSESVTIGGPMVALLLGAVVLVFGMSQGGLNTISMGGGFLMIVGVAWLAAKINSVETNHSE
jgi:hypothetical protein